MSELVLGIIATGMVGIQSLLLARAARVRTGIDALVVVLLMVMMIAMLLGPAYLYLTTLVFTLADLVWWEIAVFSGGGMMPVPILIAAKYFTEGDPERSGPLPLAGLLEHGPTLRGAYVGLLIVSEVLMGWTFNLASGLVSLSAGYSFEAVAEGIGLSLTTYWFVFTMAGEMFVTLYALWGTLKRDLANVFAVQAFVMLFTPTALQLRGPPETLWFCLEAVAMTGLVALLARYAKRRDRDARVARYLGFFIVSNAAMMVGLVWWLASGRTLGVALLMLLETGVYFYGILGSSNDGQPASSGIGVPSRSHESSARLISGDPWREGRGCLAC
jgi:hypothetical protein